MRAERQKITLLILLCAVLVLGAVTALSCYSLAAIDRIELQREQKVVERALARIVARTDSEVATAAVWDEAFRRTGAAPDLAWIDYSLGKYMHTSFGHDLTLVFDAKGRPIYASQAGLRTPPGALAAVVGRIAPVVAEVQAAEAERRRGLDPTFDPEAVALRRLRISVGGEVLVLSASAIGPATAPASFASNSPAVIVSGKTLTSEFMNAFGTELLIDGARLNLEPKGARPRSPSATKPAAGWRRSPEIPRILEPRCSAARPCRLCWPPC